jgi:hypothetical protein
MSSALRHGLDRIRIRITWRCYNFFLLSLLFLHFSRYRTFTIIFPSIFIRSAPMQKNLLCNLKNNLYWCFMELRVHGVTHIVISAKGTRFLMTVSVKTFSHVIDWIQTGFWLVVGSNELLQIIVSLIHTIYTSLEHTLVSTQCICVFRMALTVNSDCFPKQH